MTEDEWKALSYLVGAQRDQSGRLALVQLLRSYDQPLDETIRATLALLFAHPEGSPARHLEFKGHRILKGWITFVIGCGIDTLLPVTGKLYLAIDAAAASTGLSVSKVKSAYREYKRFPQVKKE